MRSPIPPTLTAAVIAILATAPEVFAFFGRANVKVALTGLGLVLAAVIGVCIYHHAYRFLTIFLFGLLVYVFFVAASVVWIGVPTRWW